MERIRDMPLLLLFVFRFVRLLLSGHQAVAIENAALRMQIAAFQRKRKRPLLTTLGSDVLDCAPESVVRLAQALALRPGRHGCALAARAVPEILGQAVSAPAAAPRSPPHRR